MKTRSMIAAIAAATGLFVTGAIAQHEEHHNDQAAPPSGQAGTAKSDTGKMGNMMAQMPASMSTMMSKMMPEMTMAQSDTSRLVDQLAKSFAAIDAVKVPAALKQKLAAHGALLKELQAKVEAQSHHMEMMQKMMADGMKGGEHK